MKERNVFRLPFSLRIILLIFYLVILTYLLFFAEALGRTGGSALYNNFIPFREIIRYFARAKRLGAVYVLRNFCGNIACFIPFGFLFASLLRYPMPHAGARVTGLSCALSALVEFLQFVTNTGCCDVDDVILNTTGGLIGFLIFRGLFVEKTDAGDEDFRDVD